MSLCSILRRPRSAVYVVNEATVVSDATVKRWCTAVQYQIRHDVAPAWQKPAKGVRFSEYVEKIPSGAWIVAVLDDADQADALGYHSVDDQGRAYARVFAKTALDYGQQPSVTFSHEVLETWGDPSVDEWVTLPSGSQMQVPLELCDAVESDWYTVKGVAVSNFLTPAWFGEGSLRLTDHLGTTPGPFKLAKGGYTVRRWPDGKTDEVFGETYNRQYKAARDHRLGRGVRRSG